MNCEAYEALLMQLVEGNLPPEDEARLREHEAVCPACAQRRADAEALLADLSDLKEEELPLPADFHQGWTRMVEEEANVMQKEKATGKKKSSWRRVLSVAAAAVVLVGGTLLTRDQLSGVTRPQTAAQSRQRSVESYDYAGDVSPYAYTDEEAAYDSGANGAGLMMSAASGADDTAVDTTKIIRTASLTLGTQDFEQDLEQLQAYCKDSGGWVSYVSQSGDADKANRRASLTLRIPVEKLDELLAAPSPADYQPLVPSRTYTYLLNDTGEEFRRKPLLLNVFSDNEEIADGNQKKSEPAPEENSAKPEKKGFFAKLFGKK